MSDESGSNGFSWFLAGLGLGALVGVLYAPKSGKETREDLAVGARESGEYLKQRGRDAADQFGNLVDRGRERADEYVDRGKEYVNRGKEQWEDIVGQGKNFVAEQTDKVSAAVEAGKQAYQSTTHVPSEPNHL